VVQTQGAITEEFARHCFSEVIQGMIHLHAVGIAHRDISVAILLCHFI
jgi:serine/threonine protein kinase